MPTLEDAIRLATEVHEWKKDKGGDPYILHPLRVMLRMGSDLERTVAVLHDVVEDSPYTLERLRDKGYSEEVVAAVDALTRRDSENYQEFIKRAARNPVARKVKIADLEDNMDIRRLQEVTDEAAERLRKYLKAWRDLRE